jgi:hypothetical protein
VFQEQAFPMLGLAERTLRILLPMEHRHKVRLNYK